MSDQIIRIAYPLALDVAASITKAIGLMWPDAMIDTTDSRHLTIRLPNRPKRVAQKLVKAQKVESAEDTPTADITDWDGETLTVATDPQHALAEWAYALLEAGGEAAVNYVEQEATTKEGRKLVVIAAWSKEQTPHKLRMLAEKRAEAAESKLAELGGAQ